MAMDGMGMVRMEWNGMESEDAYRKPMAWTEACPILVSRAKHVLELINREQLMPFHNIIT